MSYRARRILQLASTLALLAMVIVFVLFPFYWLLVTAFRPSDEIFTRGGVKLYPSRLSLEGFRELFRRTRFALYMRNSAITSSLASAITLVVSAMAAYSLSRFRYPGRNIISIAIFFTYLVPGSLIFIPLYVLLHKYHLYDTLVGLTLSFLTFTVPFCTWMLRGYLMSIPRDMEEAALIDGCTRLQALYKVILPLAAPGLAAALVFSFTLAFNNYLFALVFVSSDSLRTAPIALTGLIFEDVFLWGAIMGGALLTALPVMILYMLAQRFLVQGLMAGAVKG